MPQPCYACNSSHHVVLFSDMAARLTGIPSLEGSASRVVNARWLDEVRHGGIVSVGQLGMASTRKLDLLCM